MENGIKAHLLYTPSATSKSRIKKLRQPAPAQFRIRLGELRVFYDIVDEIVNVTAILTKHETVDWLKQELENDSD